MSYTGRLAPSPTGLLHLGHARTFCTAYDRACAANGKLWLRDDDLDPQRSGPEFAAAIREDLSWLGIQWHDEVKQSDRLPLYQRAAEELLAAGHIYPCHCSRRDLQRSIHAPHEDDDEPIYPGTCRPPIEPGARRRALRKWAAPPQPLAAHTNYRFHVPDHQTIRFTDLHAGPQAFRAGCDEAAQFGDFLVWRRDGLPSYQLACVVDDAAMAITEVVRGRDLLKSTARQLLLQRALHLPTPAFFHTDLMLDERGIRLAKRHDALSLRTLRDAGVTPGQVRERLQLLPRTPVIPG